MKSRWVMLAAALATLAALDFAARAQDGADVADASAQVAALQDLYAQHLARNAAPIARPSDRDVMADNFGCPDDTAFWMRDSLTPLCEPLCSSDQDCGPDDGRCRLLNLNDMSAAPPMLLVDDMSPDEVADVLNDENNSIPPIQICDPFFDIVGATDAQHSAG